MAEALEVQAPEAEAEAAQEAAPEPALEVATEAAPEAAPEESVLSPSSFSFSKDAVEFVPSTPSSQKAFAFNIGASEFKPGAYSSSPTAGPVPHSPTAGPTFLQPVPVIAPAGVPVYPVVAVRPTTAASRPFAYVAPVSAIGPVSPTGAAAVGYAPNLSAFHDGHSPQAAGTGHDQRKGAGRGSQHRQGYKGSRKGDAQQESKGQQQQQQQPAAQASDEPVIADADLPPLRRPGEEHKEEKKEEDKEEEKEEEDGKGPKKPSWADMIKKSQAKPASPAQGSDPQRILPKRVPTKARGAVPASAAAAAAATLAAPSAVAASAALLAAEAPSAASVAAPASGADSVAAAPAAAVPEEAQSGEDAAAPSSSIAASASEALAGAEVIAPEMLAAESSAADQSPDAEAEPASAASDSGEKPKEKGPPSWADRLKQSAPPLARPKKAAPSKPVGIPSNPTRAPWAKAAVASASSPTSSGADQATGADLTAGTPKDAWEQQDEAPEAATQATNDKEVLEETATATAEDAAGQPGPGTEVAPTEEVESGTETPLAADVEENADAEDGSIEAVAEPLAPAIDAEPDAGAAEDGDTGDEEEEEEEEEEDVDAEETSTADINIIGDAESLTAVQSLKLAPDPIKPDSNGIIKYSVDFLKSMALAPASQGTCPANIPRELRRSEDGEDINKGGMSPTDERKRYKMDFLKQFKGKAACQELPANHRIPKDIRAATLSSSSPSKGNRGAGADPSGAIDKEDDWRADQAKHHARMKDTKGGRQGDRRDRDRKTGRPFRQEEALVSSETSWAQQQHAKKQDSDSMVVREMKSILNKLTVEKFDKLYQKLLECGIETKEHIEKLMREVFEKATMQHHFISMYTELCIKLNEWLQDRGIVDEDDKPVSFKRILLNQCQDSFERYLTPPEGLEDLSEEELFEAKLKYKTKMLGNMKFVGSLLIQKVLSTKIIFQCTNAMLDNPSEEKLETLCAFLNTIGPAYDSKDWKNYDDLTRVFAEVKALSSASNKEHDIPPRIKCLLRDVCDLRSNGWDKTLRPSNAPEGPMRIADVKAQFQKENTDQERKDKGGGKGAPAPLQETDDGWATVGDARRSSAGKQAAATPMGKGSGGSLATPSSQARPATTRAEGSSNSFGLLDRRSKEKKDKKDVEWRRSDTAPSLGGRPEWKPRTPEKDRAEKAPELGRSTSSPSDASPAKEEPSAKECQREMGLTINELASSHDLEEATARVQAFKIPARHQKDVVREMFANIAEQGVGNRPCLISFIVKLFGAEEPKKEILRRTSLIEGLEDFVESRYLDLKCDVPKLPEILQEELLPALGKEVLSSKDVAAIKAKIEAADASEA